MALGAMTAGRSGGQSPSRPLMIYRINVVGDNNVPAGGTLDLTTTIRAALGMAVDIIDVWGYGVVTATGAGSGHFVQYLPATDALQILALSNGAEVTGNQSANTYRLVVACQ